MTEGGTRIELGSLLATLFELIRRYAALFALATLSLAAVDTILEMTLKENGSLAASNVLSIIVGFLVVRHVLRNEDMMVEEGRFGSYFRTSLLSGLGMLVGFIFLIVPGFYLLARWSVAPLLALTRGLTAREALGASWQATRNSAWIVALVYAVGFAIFVAAVALVGGLIAYGGGNADSLAPVVFNQIIGDLAVTMSAFLSVAIYSHVIDSANALEDVFA